MLRTRRRKSVLAAAALVATTMLLTACQGEDTEDGSKSTGATASESAAKGKSGDGGSGTGTGTGTGGESPSGEKGSKSGMVSGKWAGTVSYLAPGKYTVTDANGTEQAFFTSEDTDIEGAGKICGDADGQAATPCTEEELEAAAKKGFGATVDVKDGVAVSIIEDHTDSGNGGGNGMGEGERSGLFSGTLGYMAPGKYSLSRDGNERAFVTTTDTVINGAGWICGDAQTVTPCTEKDLEAAAKKGSVAVAVQVEDGVAVTIDEEHN
ncbi:hypothetical protein [Streptomyces sp. AC627_RSS907]|uniref:hypothetical protein n=1 Tax=Streptomyces sp. AC627_RSS907 TaxID=2823684 RepID=UPI001C2320BE|nr:hypothetical protein [Streptomyces sp. AC627_RSS907]